jgi:hypothetical protein
VCACMHDAFAQRACTCFIDDDEDVARCQQGKGVRPLQALRDERTDCHGIQLAGAACE